LFEHLFVALPGEVNEFRIAAYGYDFGPQFFELSVLLCQSSKFRCSDEGEVGRIEEQDGPFPRRFLCSKVEFAKIAFGWFKCFEFKIRNALANLQTAAISRHFTPSLCCP
jgi:hypothetical protein